MNDGVLTGKVAVITGAGRGIGKSIALSFAKAGADLAICARDTAGLDAVAELVKGFGRKCLFTSVDMADAVQTRDFANEIINEFGYVDILVNNAGAYLERGQFKDSDPNLWWNTLEVNVRGPYTLTRALVEHMRVGSKIINLTSGKGFNAGANSSAYHVSKAALNMLTDCLANELWEQQIEVNSLVPGPTATANFENKPPQEARTADEIIAQSKESLPKGLPAWERVKHPDEVAAFALQMASYPTGGPTGQVFSLARRPF